MSLTGLPIVTDLAAQASNYAPAGASFLVGGKVTPPGLPNSVPLGASRFRVLTGILVAGTVTIADTATLAGTLYQVTRQLVGGTLGHLSVGTITAGTSVVINSSNNADTSTVTVLAIDP